MKKIKVLAGINSFRYGGKRYFPGDIINIEDNEADRLLKNDFLALFKGSETAPAAQITNIEASAPAAEPAENSEKKKRKR